jgi:nicotinate phosphoribosyltransferase
MKNRQIITSILDTDLYKFSMMNYALRLFPNSYVSYKFNNRGTQRFNKEFLDKLKKQISYLSSLSLQVDEYLYLKENLPYLDDSYIEYLRNFRFNPSNVSVKLTEDNDLDLTIEGKWVDIILFEVPLMSIISELYFSTIETKWWKNNNCCYANQWNQAHFKIKKLSSNGCNFADFGTRRRRNFKTQDKVINAFYHYNKNYKNSTLAGTSNLYFAKKYNLKTIGTMGHEVIMHASIAEGLRNANYYALMNWKRTFVGNLGVFLPDTYGTDAFLNNFTLEMAKLYDGTRWDSGDWKEFTNKILDHYKKLCIDPMSKTIVFSDSLDVDRSIKIKKYCEGKIKCSFGIGTHFTGCFSDSPPLNIVIKLNTVRHNGFDVPAIKLSDSPGKEMGNPDAIRVAKWMFFNQSLDG